MGQNIDYSSVKASCEELSGIAINVSAISSTLRYSYMTTDNKGEFSESFEELIGIAESIIGDISSFIKGYSSLVLAVSADYQQVDQEMKNMINES